MKPMILRGLDGWKVEFAGKTTKVANRAEAYSLAYALENGIRTTTGALVRLPAVVEAYRRVPRVRKARPLGVSVARMLLTGDYQTARIMGEFRRPRSWSVPEARALLAAIRVANDRFNGSTVHPSEFGL